MLVQGMGLLVDSFRAVETDHWKLRRLQQALRQSGMTRSILATMHNKVKHHSGSTEKRYGLHLMRYMALYNPTIGYMICEVRCVINLLPDPSLSSYT